MYAAHVEMSDGSNMIFQSYRASSNVTDQVYTWSLFLKEVSPWELVKELEDSSPSFVRGLPSNSELRNIFVLHILFTVLCKGTVTDDDFAAENEKEALLKCFHRGWLHTDKLDNIGRPYEIGYFFASSLHRWYVQWKLFDTLSRIPFDESNALQFVTKPKIGPNSIQDPPEAQYQQEFFRCCHSISKGSLIALREFGTKEGRVDFYIPSKKWGVELLRNGDQLAQHRKKARWDVSDHVILDCRTTYPTKKHISEIFY